VLTWPMVFPRERERRDKSGASRSVTRGQAIKIKRVLHSSLRKAIRYRRKWLQNERREGRLTLRSTRVVSVKLNRVAHTKLYEKMRKSCRASGAKTTKEAFVPDSTYLTTNVEALTRAARDKPGGGNRELDSHVKINGETEALPMSQTSEKWIPHKRRNKVRTKAIEWRGKGTRVFRRKKHAFQSAAKDSAIIRE